MAWAKGTATDFIDFLRQIRDYAAGVTTVPGDGLTDGETVPVDDRWAILSNGAGMPSVPSSGFATDGEVYLQGPGSDPADEIIVGFKTYRNVGANIFGIAIRGFTAFDSGLTFDTLPGVSPDARVALDDASFSTWIWVNRRRIIAVARVGTVDVLLHAGFIQQYGTRNQYPYPLLVSGSVVDTSRSFQTNNFGHSSLPDPCDNGAYLRWVDGTWQEYANYQGTSDVRSVSRKPTGNVVWPNRNPNTNADGADTAATAGSEDAIFEGFTPTGAPQISNSEIGAYSMFPSVLVNGSAIVGKVDGLYTVFGLGLVSGDTLTDSSTSPPTVYDVFANTWRSEAVDFYAVKRN